MTDNPIPDYVKFTGTDYILPPECCRCNSKLGDSSLKVSGTIGGRGRFYVAKTFNVPICSDCLEDIDKATKERERRIIRPAFRVLVVSGTIMIAGRVLYAAHLFGELGVAFFAVSLLFAVPALGTIAWAKMNCGFRELNKTALLGPQGFVFGNKDYQARVKAVSETYVPRSYVT
jgi:uncharacterized protein (DUF983 family)